MTLAFYQSADTLEATPRTLFRTSNISVSPPSPSDPDEPRRGGRSRIATWITVGVMLAVVIVIVVVVAVARSGTGKHAATPKRSTPNTVPTPSTSPSRGSAARTGSYKIIFRGVGTGDVTAENKGQKFLANTTSASWDLVYIDAVGHSLLPDPATSKVRGAGTYAVKAGGIAGCVATAVKLRPNLSIIKPSGGDRYSLVPPLAGDLVSAAGCDPAKHQGDPFYQAWGAVCPAVSLRPTPTTVPDSDCAARLLRFETAHFTIKDGQKGTVVTDIPKRTFLNIGPQDAGTLSGERSLHTWSGTITVIAQ